MNIQEAVPLSEITYYRIGGKARFVIKVHNIEEVRQAVIFLQKQKDVRIYILGLGTNTLFPDNCSNLGIIWLQEDGSMACEGNKITAFAGENLDALINFSLGKNLVGLEWAGGLPSTIGGAVRGNAGAFGSEIKKCVAEVSALDVNDPSLVVRAYTYDECNFSYRNSFFKEHQNFIIVSVVLTLTQADQDSVLQAKETYLKNIAYRNQNHPMEYPSCGSVFKNIVDKSEVEKIVSIWPDIKDLSERKWHNKVSMGYVINRLGFSEKKIGGAMVSPKHTNYIVNTGGATAHDVQVIIKEIENKFEDVFGFLPEPEVMLVS